MRTTAIIVEERPGAREALSFYLNELIQEVTVSGVTDTLEKGRLLADAHKPEVVFLGDSGIAQGEFQWAESVVILTESWWPGEKLKQCGFVDQLLLPVSLDDLRAVIDRVTEGRRQQQKLEAGEMRIVPDELEKRQMIKVSIPVVKGFQFQPLRDIVMLSSSGSYTDFLLRNGRRFQSSRSLKYFSEKLETHGFFRCHDSYLINLNELETYYKGRGGTVVMSSGDELPVSRYRREGLLRALTHPSSFASTPIED